MRISDWSSDVCSSDLIHNVRAVQTSFSPPTLAIAPIADEKEIFLINGGGVSASLIGASKYLVPNRSLATDMARGMTLRAPARGFEKMAILAWTPDTGDIWRRYVEKLCNELGHPEVAREAAGAGT